MVIPVVTVPDGHGEGVKLMGVSARKTQGAWICGAFTMGLLLGGCTSSAEPQATASPTVINNPIRPSSPATSPTSGSASSPSVNDDTLTINITIASGKTTPSGKKMNVQVGQKVILNVTSDTDDEIHAHIGGEGCELPVQAGKPAKGSFTLDNAGSFEVESHLLEKIIVILNAR
jgi:hypothetical protein